MKGGRKKEIHRLKFHNHAIFHSKAEVFISQSELAARVTKPLINASFTLRIRHGGGHWIQKGEWQRKSLSISDALITLHTSDTFVLEADVQFHATGLGLGHLPDKQLQLACVMTVLLPLSVEIKICTHPVNPLTALREKVHELSPALGLLDCKNSCITAYPNKSLQTRRCTGEAKPLF